MKAYSGEKHKKSGKHDGSKPAEERNKGEKRTSPRFENFNGKPTE
jgi:hypothetical protein